VAYIERQCIRLFVAVTKTIERREDLFWLMVLKVSVHGWLDPLLSGHGRRVWQKKELLTSWQVGKRERQERAGDKVHHK
jgi:hypothetical protein